MIRCSILVLVLLAVAAPVAADLAGDVGAVRDAFGRVASLCRQNKYTEARGELTRANQLFTGVVRTHGAVPATQTLMLEASIWRTRIDVHEDLFKIGQQLRQASRGLAAPAFMNAASHVDIANTAVRNAQEAVLHFGAGPIRTAAGPAIGPSPGPAAAKPTPAAPAATPAAQEFGFFDWILLILKWIVYVGLILFILFVLLIVVLLIYFKIDEYYYEKQFAQEDMETGAPPPPKKEEPKKEEPKKEEPEKEEPEKEEPEKEEPEKEEESG